MYIVSFFTESGAPKTGLHPAIEVWRVEDNYKVVDAAAMSEIGGGFYKYLFADYDSMKEYAIKCDGGATLSTGERYTYAGNEGFHDDITEIQDTISIVELLIRRILGLSQENYRLSDTVYDVTGKRLISCTIKIFNNKDDCNAYTNAFATYKMQSIYGQDGQLSDYKVVRE